MDAPNDRGPTRVVVAPSGVTTNIPRNLGILNIVFGCLLLLCGLSTAFYMWFTSDFMPAIAAQQNQEFERAMTAQREREIRALERQEQEAKTEEEKAEWRAKREALEAEPIPKGPDFEKMQEAMKPLFPYMMVDMISGSLLNLIMIISGVGLLMTTEWGRVSALVTAVLKVLRLLLSQVYFLLFVVPVVAKTYGEMLEEMMGAAGGPGAPPPGTFATVYGTMMSVSSVALIVFGSIYPIISIVLLTRERVKAACQRRPIALSD